MKVKVGNKVYDGIKEPIMVILTQEDKKNIANMTGRRYCLYPSTGEWTVKRVEEWMNPDANIPV